MERNASRRGDRLGARRAWPPTISGVVVAVVVLAAAFLVPVRADDIWWHLEAGERMVETARVLDRNTFSFTAPDHPWIAHEWLSEVLFYTVFDSLGPLWLVLLGAVLVGATCAVVFAVFERSGTSPFLAAAGTMLAAFLLVGNLSLRPWLFGNLLFVATVALVEARGAGGSGRPAWVALLFGAWANLHGSFPLGLAVLALALVEAVVERAFRRRSVAVFPRAVDLCAALVATVVTPHHVRGLLLPLSYFEHLVAGGSSALGAVSEWQPVEPFSALGLVLAAVTAFVSIVVVLSGRAPRPVHVGLFVGVVALAFAAIRNASLLGIAATPVLAAHLQPAFERSWSALARRYGRLAALERAHARFAAIDARSSRALAPGLAVALVVATMAVPTDWRVGYVSLTGTRSLSDLTPRAYPRGALEALERIEGVERIFNHFDWGGAAIFALAPERRVFIDQRNDCYPEEVFRDYLAVHRVEPRWREVLERWRVDAVAYPAASALAAALRHEPGWRVDFEDDQAVVFGRDEPRTDGPAQPPSDEPSSPPSTSRR